MPIFLMQYIVVALLRTLLFKFGVHNVAIHVVFGIAISFVGPMMAVVNMKKVNSWIFSFIRGSLSRSSKEEIMI